MSLDGASEPWTPLKHTKLVIDDGQFREVPTRPHSPHNFDLLLNTEMDLNSASLVATASRPPFIFQDSATTTSTAPAAIASVRPFPPPSRPVPPPSKLFLPPSGPFLPPSSPHIPLSNPSPSPSNPFPPPSNPFPPLSSASLPPSTLVGGLQPAMSQASARVVIKAYILDSAWFKTHEMEPRVGEAGVPECALLLASLGDSIWACFFRRVRRNRVANFKCAECPHITDRLNRAVEHQRSEWRHQPFACSDLGWYDAGITVGICLSADWTFYLALPSVNSVDLRVVVFPTIVV